MPVRGADGLRGKAIKADPLWAALWAAFRTIKGVAGRTGGQMNGKRRVRSDREGIRSILFIVAGGLRRDNPDFTAFHHRLCDPPRPSPDCPAKAPSVLDLSPSTVMMGGEKALENPS